MKDTTAVRKILSDNGYDVQELYKNKTGRKFKAYVFPSEDNLGKVEEQCREFFQERFIDISFQDVWHLSGCGVLCSVIFIKLSS